MAMFIFHWEYILFPIVVLILLALILVFILAADLTSEDRSKMEIIQDLFRYFRKRLQRR